ncbi:TonB-dependent receptor [Rhodanobacter sp. B04]|uniref:TonB-dependent receptor n=1 Tax=Rhodanobacter sp. B04 TaxID=1945860 RepID=UPI000984F922|nr:TonB-dependent receptor [Rhodanobacter sp. B04]OOG61936.1 TonB-dependent receptor [Rhodanobacter sp. B04]
MSCSSSRRAPVALALTLLASSITHAQDAPSSTAQKPTTLAGVEVSAPSSSRTKPDFPATQASIPAEKIQATVNAVDVEDAAKYLPSIFIRKRNYGDTQPVLATRNWGVNSSARTLVYVDDIPISALIANNNTMGAPRWGMASPETIDHIDMLYGPFSAAYSGNSMGGVMRIVTKLPDKPQVTIKQTEAVQDFDLYGTHDRFSTSQTSVTAGAQSGPWGWFVSANALNSFSQPLSYITGAGFPNNTSGAIPARNKTGQVANVLGAGGLLHTRMLGLNGKLSYDITPWLQASYMAGFWSNHGQSNADTFLTDGAGNPTYGKTAGFASSIYGLSAHHLMQAASLKTDTKGDFDGELVITHYAFLKDSQWNPAGVTTGTDVTTNGRLASYAGTNWSTVDLRGVWRPQGYGGAQEVSAGAHADRYELANTTTNLTNWQVPPSTTTLYSAGSGKTATDAVWVQDAWRLDPAWLLTVGGRYEWWKASDGFNFSGQAAVHQPSETSNAFSPKASLQWSVAPDWLITGSLAKSVRFPTVGELYQLVSTGSTYTSPNPNLKPERSRDGELAFEHSTGQGSVRLSLFQENTRDALIQQTAFLSQYPVPVNYVVNVGEVRNRGVELAAQQDNVLVRGLELSGSITFVDSTILSDDTFASTTGTTAKGQHAPYVPRLRATAVATYRPNEAWSFTLAGRYSGRQYSTLDNTDNTPHVFGAFDKFTVFDARVQYQIDEHLSLAVGVDNLTNEKYFLYHPFQQRTYVADLKLTL